MLDDYLELISDEIFLSISIGKVTLKKSTKNILTGNGLKLYSLRMEWGSNENLPIVM